MAATPDVAPLEMLREGNHLRFVFAHQAGILSELPRDYEALLDERLNQVLAEPGPLTAEIDLRDIPGVSSRQLGSLIALQKVLRPRFGRLPITGLSEGVRRSLVTTRVDQLFAID